MDVELHYKDKLVEVFRAVIGDLANNVYVVRCRVTGMSFMVDAPNDPDLLLKICRDMNVTRIFGTHRHRPHIASFPHLLEEGYLVGIGDDDKDSVMHNFVISHGDKFRCGDLVIRAISTPGHTPGSICISVDHTPLLFTGDTLFPGGPGATNQEGGDFDAIIKSITTHIFGVMPEDTMILPGHGDDTIIAKELPYLDEWIARRW